MTEHEHPNVTLVRRGFQAFGEGDMTWMVEHLADDIVWHVPGNNVQSGDKVGRDATLAFFAETIGLTGGTFHIEMHDVVGGDAHVVALTTNMGQRPDGRSLAARIAQIFHVVGDQATEVWAFAEDQAAVDAFFND